MGARGGSLRRGAAARGRSATFGARVIAVVVAALLGFAALASIAAGPAGADVCVNTVSGLWGGTLTGPVTEGWTADYHFSATTAPDTATGTFDAGTPAPLTATVTCAGVLDMTSPFPNGNVTFHSPGIDSATQTAAGTWQYTQFSGTWSGGLLPTGVTSLSPSNGSTVGGAAVTITGTNLAGATSVEFGDTAASTFTVDSNTEITATAPAHDAGVVDVTVTAPGGTSAPSSGDEFTYAPPVPIVTAVSPPEGQPAGGASVTITGSRLTDATDVFFGASAATSFVVNSDSSILATSPAGTGAVDVTVVNTFGTSTTSPADRFVYGNGYPSMVLSNNPLAYWRLGEASDNPVAADSSGNGRNGVYDSCVGRGVPGAIAGDPDTAASFLANDCGVTFTPSASDSYSGDFTAEALVNPTADTEKAGYTFLSSRFPDSSSGSTEFSFDFKLEGTDGPSGTKQLYADVGDGSGWALTGGVDFDWQPGDWYAVAVTVDASHGIATFYVDGQSIGTRSFAPLSALLFDQTHPMEIGQTERFISDINPEYFDGTIDEVALYPSVLSSSQLLDDYTVTGIAPANTPPVLDLPDTVTAEATSSTGAEITYSATASDQEDGSLSPTCMPGSGSLFAIGTSTVNCSVTDSFGATTTGSFDIVVDPTVPTAPTIGTATGGNGSASVSFSAPADDGGSTITGYAVSCVSSNGGATGSNTGASSPILVSRLTNGKSYTCTASASNDVGPGPASDPSNTFVPSSAPGKPTVGTVTLSGTTATVPFTPPSNDGGSSITNYTATCTSTNGGTARTASHATSPVPVLSLSPGKTYTCSVKATNAVGTSLASAPSNAVTVAQVPAAPTSAHVVSGSTTTTTGPVTVTFTAPTSDGGSAITSYTATCTSSDGGATKTGVHAGATAAAITVAGVTTGKTYTCTVAATNAIGTSVPSAASPSVIAGSPAAPTAARAVSGSTTTATGSLTVTFTNGANNGSAITSQTATCTSSNGGVTKTGTHTGAAAAAISVAGVTTGKTYTCTVAATNARGVGLPSVASLPVIVGSPAAPTAVHAVAGSTTTATGSLRVTFTIGANNGSAITGQTATCASSDGGVTKTGTHAGATAATITVTGMTTGKTYTCTVTATNARGVGMSSAASLPVIVGSPAAPTSVTAVKTAAGQIKVTFTAGANNGSAITSFTATCTSSTGGVSGTNSASVGPITVTGLTATESYTCTVTATNARGTGLASSASAVVTA
jgi:hypothetical protein